MVDLIIHLKIAGRKYQGLIVHVNNFDILLSDKQVKKQVVIFFQEIRDFLQTPHVYFLFLGPKALYADVIAPEKRLKSIFHPVPLILHPLSKQEVSQAIEERLLLLQSPDVNRYISPFSNDVIYTLYHLYEGDVRSIMNGLKAILSQVTKTVLEPLGVDEALLLLGKERWLSLDSFSLTKEQIAILKLLATSKELIAQKNIAKLAKKAPSNISGYYFNPLRDAGIIEVKKQVGKVKYWGLTTDYYPIKFLLETQQKIRSKADASIGQLSLY